MDSKKLMEDLQYSAHDAGEKIMRIYEKDFDVYEKEDKSPLTKADEVSHQLIVEFLRRKYPKIPVLSEESQAETWERRKNWESYFLVDPLDGTKEFIKKNGEFTVNIALIANNKPVAGVVYVPAQNVSYYAHKDLGAFKDSRNKTCKLNCSAKKLDIEHLKIIGSRSHQSDLMKEFASNFKEHEIVAAGSSLKFCILAEGSADIYPRFGPTSEWDTAAGQCVLECSGGMVYEDSGAQLVYNNKESLLNPYFLALRKYNEYILDCFMQLSTKAEY